MYALFIHGIGSQTADYAKDAIKYLGKGLGKQPLYTRSVLFTHVLDLQSTKFLADVKTKGSEGNLTQRFVISTIADALQYSNNPKTRGRILEALDNEFVKLRAPDEAVIFAHSLGALVALDWLRTRIKVKNVRLVTLGANIGLFEMGKPVDVPPQLKKPGRWYNLFDKDDLLGYAVGIRPETAAHVKDMKVSVGGFLIGRTGLAHIKYWEDEELWKNTIPRILQKK